MNPSEISFWKQNLYEHTLMIYDTLSPKEKEAQQNILFFIQKFDGWFREKKEIVTAEFIQDIQAFQSFVIQLLRKQLTSGLKILLTPTFLNHMITENSEAITRVTMYEEKSVIGSHLTWLPVLAGDAFTIQGALDSVEQKYVSTYLHYFQEFEKEYVFAMEIAGFTRTGLTQFPALDKFQSDTKTLLTKFVHELQDLEQLETNNSILDKLPVFFVRHVKKEAQYYMNLF